MEVGLVTTALLIGLMQDVSCKTWNVVLPKMMRGISGSCVAVPCQFDIPDHLNEQLINCSGLWRTESINGPFVSLGTQNMQGRIVGDLRKNNCTTLFYSFPDRNSESYFFRVECSEVNKFTFKDAVRIFVQQGMPPPLMNPVSQVVDGDQVRLWCSTPVPCPDLPPSIAWLPPDNSRHEETYFQQSKDGLLTLMSKLTFKAFADHHNQSLTCTVSYPLRQGGSAPPSAATQTLHVLYAPRSTVATLCRSGPVSEGHIVTFTCRSDANPPVRAYTWYITDKAGKLMKTGEGRVLVLNVSQRDSGEYLCEAQNTMGSQRSRPVPLEVNTAIDISSSVVLLPYIICGVVLVLYVLTVIVDVYKYKSLSRSLKQIELKGEHSYMNLSKFSVPDYEQIQPRQPKTTTSPDVHHYVQSI